jgi:hypothetical protein
MRRLVLVLTLVLGLLSCAPATTPARAAERRAAGPTRRVSFNKARYPRSRALVVRGKGSFPRLGDNFEVLDPTTGKRYNCIAHSLGIHSRWVNPETGPPGRRLERMDRMYRRLGYVRVRGLDFRRDRRLRKVVVYAHVSGGNITKVTHAAVQQVDGTWTSKLGQWPLIRHLSPQAVSGPSYGVPVAVYVKARRPEGGRVPRPGRATEPRGRARPVVASGGLALEVAARLR